MRGIVDISPRNLLGVIVLAAGCMTLGCSSDPPPPPDLSAGEAAYRISERWAREEMNHFKVTFHSDTLVECGVKNDLWKLVEVTDRNGNSWSTVYQLTEKGTKIVTAASIKETGRGHEILLRGPYKVEITGITDGSQPNTKNVAFRWDIDWDKAPADLKACLPRFELSGNETAVFVLNGTEWAFDSYLNPEDMAPPDNSAPAPAPAAAPSTPVFSTLK